VELSESGSGDDLRLEITGVTDGSAAARAGLRAGDRIESLNDRPARGYAEFASMVQGHGPGTRVQITIERDTEARLGEAEGQPRLGINLDDASISSVSSGSPAEQAALQAGDRLLEVGGQACESGDDVINAVHSHEPGEVIGITLRRVVPVVLGSRPGSSDELMTEPAEPRFDDSTRVEDERRAVAEPVRIPIRIPANPGMRRHADLRLNAWNTSRERRGQAFFKIDHRHTFSMRSTEALTAVRWSWPGQAAPSAPRRLPSTDRGTSR